MPNRKNRLPEFKASLAPVALKRAQTEGELAGQSRS